MKLNERFKRFFQLLFSEKAFSDDSISKGFSSVAMLNVLMLLILALAKLVTTILFDDHANLAVIAFFFLFIMNINIVFTIVNIVIIDKTLKVKPQKSSYSGAFAALLLVIVIAVISINKFELYDLSNPKVGANYFISFVFASGAAVFAFNNFKFFESGQERKIKFQKLAIGDRVKARIKYFGIVIPILGIAASILRYLSPVN